MKVKSIVLNVIGYITLTIVVAVIFNVAYSYAKKTEIDYDRRLNEHVKHFWSNLCFTGHNCEFGDWCTRTYYESITNKEDR